MTKFQRSTILAALALALAACSSTVPLDESGKAPIEERGGAGSGTSGPGGGDSASSRSVAPVNVEAKDPLNDPGGPLAKRSIYFDFDSDAIRSEFRATIEAHARYLVANKNRKVLIQGNTDERGTSEYNLALGQRRAEAVKSAMAALGASESQMESVSLGKEKPKAAGHDEAAWTENRRADLVYQ
jgi:peptidoglycan-associated lipoprotein